MDRTPRAALLGACGLALIGGLTLSGCGFNSASNSAPAPHTIRATTDVGAILVTYLGATSGQGSAGQSIGN